MMSTSFPSRKFLTLLCGTAAMATAAGCAKDNEIAIAGGVGITATRSACPAVAVPLHTGDITLFDPATSRDASAVDRSEEHTSELQSLMRISYAVFCLKKKKQHTTLPHHCT